MKCSSFGKCGSCVLYDIAYSEQVNIKENRLKEMFADFDIEIETITSKDSHFRARAEFRIWHEDKKSYYGMFGLKEKKIVTITECNIVDISISNIMAPLLDTIIANEYLRHKLYGVEFLSNSKGELIVTLIYHKKWEETQMRKEVEKLKKFFPQCNFVVRRKGKKIFVDRNYLIEELKIKDKIYKY